MWSQELCQLITFYVTEYLLTVPRCGFVFRAKFCSRNCNIRKCCSHCDIQIYFMMDDESISPQTMNADAVEYFSKDTRQMVVRPSR